ncbi:unnamed protein product [Gongylonema pulchrum]|uniref:Uncharacterized protein n=1 Tax=Gongylonema pulchrum TaxID=637853 RepID=A0A3P7MS57_9BILA|nr:unnamed protein product [Gongylonema pulchrum]
MTQPLKYPTIVLARDPFDFDTKYKQQVKEFLENQRFWNPSSPFNSALVFLNTTNCFRTSQYNMDL